jgi:hypothetical protein
VRRNKTGERRTGNRSKQERHMQSSESATALVQELTLICCFCFLEETGFDRECLERNPNVPGGILANRI